MLGRTTEYAIRSLVYIYIQNMEGKRSGFKEIAKKIDAPEEFTGKVMQNLTRAGLISSIKGRGGGFFFSDPSKPLTLFEIIEVIEGKEFFSKCGFGLKSCDSRNPCPMHDEYSVVRSSFYQLVNKQTIQLLASKINEKRAVLNRIEIL